MVGGHFLVIDGFILGCFYIYATWTNIALLCSRGVPVCL